MGISLREWKLDIPLECDNIYFSSYHVLIGCSMDSLPVIHKIRFLLLAIPLNYQQPAKR